MPSATPARCAGPPGRDRGGCPQHYLAPLVRALHLGFRGRYGEALVEAERSIELSPDDYDAHFWKGLLLAFQGRTEEEIAQSIQQALDLRMPPVLLLDLHWLSRPHPALYERLRQRFPAPLE